MPSSGCISLNLGTNSEDLIAAAVPQAACCRLCLFARGKLMRYPNSKIILAFYYVCLHICDVYLYGAVAFLPVTGVCYDTLLPLGSEASKEHCALPC